MAIEKNQNLGGGVLELLAKQHYQFSPFTKKLVKGAELAVQFSWYVAPRILIFSIAMSA